MTDAKGFWDSKLRRRQPDLGGSSADPVRLEIRLLTVTRAKVSVIRTWFITPHALPAISVVKCRDESTRHIFAVVHGALYVTEHQ